jgi:hypothetical protein
MEKSLPVQQFSTGFLFLCSVKTDSEKERNVKSQENHPERN